MIRPPLWHAAVADAPCLSTLGPAGLQARLTSTAGLRLRTGPFLMAIRSSLDTVAEGLWRHYGAHPAPDPVAHPWADFHLSVQPPAGLRSWLRPQCVFQADGDHPFQPLPQHQAFAMLEWGLNWCLSSQAHAFLVLHAAVLERNGQAVLLPAPPGSGKSTLCAALSLRGWRLLSDELALLDPSTGWLWGLARPVSLKNQSIEVIQRFAPEAVIGPAIEATVKGRVAQLQPSVRSVARMDQPARPRWIVLPQWSAEVPWHCETLSPAAAFLELHANAFNADVHGRAGFEAVARLVDGCTAERLTYRDLDTAAAHFESLAPLQAA